MLQLLKRTILPKRGTVLINHAIGKFEQTVQHLEAGISHNEERKVNIRDKVAKLNQEHDAVHQATIKAARVRDKVKELLA